MFIALLTDFGLKDPYVAQVKATLLKQAPQIPILDLTHQISSFNVLEGSFVLFTSYKHFPPSTLFVGIVDPGVGSKREIVLAKNQDYSFLVPNNGLLSFFVQHKLLQQAYFLEKKFPASSTFHGRDIFARVAAHLAQQQIDPTWWKEVPLKELKTFALPRPVLTPSQVKATIYYQDQFGNLLLNLENKHYAFPLGQKGVLENFPLRVVKTYAELKAGEVGLLQGSQGFWELCLNQDNLAQKLNTYPGKEISWQWNT